VANPRLSKRDQIKQIKSEKDKVNTLTDQHKWKLQKSGLQFKTNLQIKFDRQRDQNQGQYLSDNKKFNRIHSYNRKENLYSPVPDVHHSSPTPDIYNNINMRSTQKVQFPSTGRTSIKDLYGIAPSDVL
jgi:hypothetical protein